MYKKGIEISSRLKSLFKHFKRSSHFASSRQGKKYEYKVGRYTVV